MSLELYAKAMTAYFGMYGVTMTTNPDLFWSEKGIMMMPYVKAFGAATTLLPLVRQLKMGLTEARIAAALTMGRLCEPSRLA